MRAVFSPSVAVGTVQAPPSKSVAHRALICGALSGGSTVRNIPYSEDVEATLCCLERLGATVIRRTDSVTIGKWNPYQLPSDVTLPCGESGSTLRFLLPLCLLSGTPVTFTGSTRLLERPMRAYEEICRDHGLNWVRTRDSITVCGPLRAGVYSVDGSVSSQFVTGLMLALSLADGASVIKIRNTLESQPYVALTQAVQNTFGVTLSVADRSVSVPGNAVYQPTEFFVEGDCSNAAYLEAYNYVGGDVKVVGLPRETAQGDWIYTDFFTQLSKGQREFDLSDCPDLGPVMFALATVNGGAVFRGVHRLRWKESDRISAMVKELHKFGVIASVEENAVIIQPTDIHTPQGVLDGHNDHRVVMALSLLCSKVGGVIAGAEAVAKSYARYFDVLRSLSVNVRQEL